MQVVQSAELPAVEHVATPSRQEGQPQGAPVYSTVGKMLWAIQAWYANVADEKTAEAILTGEPEPTLPPL
jgi:hypothetical protein